METVSHIMPEQFTTDVMAVYTHNESILRTE